MTRSIGGYGAWVVGLVAASAACGDDAAVTPPTACQAGAERACTCPSGTAGVEICAADGSGFGACTRCAALALSFLEAPRYPTGSANPHSIAATDLDGDQRPELIVGTYGDVGVDAWVTVLHNQAGTFAMGAGYPTASGVGALAAGDLDGDRRVDLVVAHGGDVSVRLARADGSFGPATAVAAGAQITGVAIGLLDDDPIPDLAITRGGSDEVAVARGDGDGTFAPPVAYRAGDFPSAVAIADLDGDGRRDLVVTGAMSGDVIVLRGGPGGAFAPAVAYPVAANPLQLVLADVSGDGRPDVIVAASGATHVLAAGANGTLDAAVHHRFGGVGVAAADLDGDADLDLAVTSGAAVSILRNTGGMLVPDRGYVAGHFPDQLAVADLDHDGDADLAVTSLWDDAVVVLLGDGHGAFAAAEVIGGPHLPRAVALGDLDGDDRVDVVEVPGNGAAIAIRLTTAAGELAAPVEYPTTTGRNPVVVLGDVDGDHDLDVIATAAGGLAVLRNQGGGTFAAAVRVNAAGDVRSIAAADLDGDGRLDLAFAPGASNTAGLLFGRGDGSFEPVVPLTVGSQPNAMAIGDVDGDGRPDLAIAHYSDGESVTVLRNQGGRSFGDRVDYPIYATDVALADLDGDAALDLIVTNGVAGSQTVAVLRGDGHGGFAPAVSAMAPYSVGSIALGDLDGDQHPDLAVGTGGDLAVFASRRAHLSEAATFGVASECYQAAIGDLDGDGRRDVVIAGYPGLTILRNTSR